MGGQGRYSGCSKAVAVIAVGGFLGVTAFYEGGGMASSCCLLLERMAWMIFGVLRSVAVQVIWQAVTAYLFQDSGLQHHLLQVGAGVCPLFCTVIGSR